MLILGSFIVALGCVLASVRRLALAAEATELDPDLVLTALDEAAPARWVAFRDAVASRDDLPWAQAMFGALREPDVRARAAGIDEQVLDLEWRLQRWSPVPRVCASIATSAGFLFAAIGLLQGLTPAADSAEVRAALMSSLNSLLVGVAATVFCGVVHLRTRRATRARMAAAERLVARLRSEASTDDVPL
jgi:hypothetical protein